MSLLRRQFLSLLASSSTLAMRTAHAESAPSDMPLAVLTFTLPGLPLIYGGQESCLTKRLEFFEKDPIAWKTRELQPFYTPLLDVGNERLFAFKRALGADRVSVVVNVTASEQKLCLGAAELSLPAHGWLIEST